MLVVQFTIFPQCIPAKPILIGNKLAASSYDTVYIFWGYRVYLAAFLPSHSFLYFALSSSSLNRPRIIQDYESLFLTGTFALPAHSRYCSCHTAPRKMVGLLWEKESILLAERRREGSRGDSCSIGLTPFRRFGDTEGVRKSLSRRSQPFCRCSRIRQARRRKNSRTTVRVCMSGSLVKSFAHLFPTLRSRLPSPSMFPSGNPPVLFHSFRALPLLLVRNRFPLLYDGALFLVLVLYVPGSIQAFSFSDPRRDSWVAIFKLRAPCFTSFYTSSVSPSPPFFPSPSSPSPSPLFLFLLLIKFQN